MAEITVSVSLTGSISPLIMSFGAPTFYLESPEEVPTKMGSVHFPCATSFDALTATDFCKAMVVPRARRNGILHPSQAAVAAVASFVASLV